MLALAVGEDMHIGCYVSGSERRVVVFVLMAFYFLFFIFAQLTLNDPTNF